jgi:hypothetical protein
LLAVDPQEVSRAISPATRGKCGALVQSALSLGKKN